MKTLNAIKYNRQSGLIEGDFEDLVALSFGSSQKEFKMPDE